MDRELYQMINRKLVALLNFLGKDLDFEENLNDFQIYCEIVDFARETGGLIFEIDDKKYMVINFTDNEGFLIIPVEGNLENI